MNRYGLLGEKLSHSQSKIIHEYLFEKHNLNYQYDLIEIKENEILDKINLLKSGYYSGFNVTVPYKEKVLQYIDVLSEAASKIGAVNTIYCKDGLVIGDNTDYLGFIDELNVYNISVKEKDVYVLGSGGASKAICYALDLLGANVILVSRNEESGISYADLENISHFDLIINTTPVGMYPNVDKEILRKEIVEKASCCIDLICNPKETKFLEYAKEGYNGIYMLIYQAIHAEALWNNNFDVDVLELYKML